MQKRVSWKESHHGGGGGGEGRESEHPAGTELRRIKKKTDDTRLATLQSTRLMVQLFNECEDAGIGTLSLLHRQREQLDRTEERLDSIQTDLSKAEETLIQIEREEGRCCPCCPFLPWNMSSKDKARKSVIWFPKPQSEESEDFGIDLRRDATVETDPISAPSSPGRKKLSVHIPSRAQGSAARKSVEFIEAEIGDNVEQISSIVRNLNRVAKDMEGELISSNVQLDVINAKAESNVRRVSAATKHAKNVYEIDSTPTSSSSPASWFDCRTCWVSNKFAAAGAITKF